LADKPLGLIAYERRSEASPMHGRGKGRSEKTQRLLDSTVSLSAAGRRERAEVEDAP